MPELPEVERARRLIQESCTGFTIQSVDAHDDKIVFCGDNQHLAFAKELEGRQVTGAERYGKQFWITLSGDGMLPLLHFGMTGMIQLRGGEPTWYRRKYNLGETSDVWPPKFCKFVLKLSRTTSTGSETRELAFLDPRRLGRARLVPSPPREHPPLSELGFDPVLSHPTLEEFKDLISAKKGVIKGVIMDQAFSAGVGNWVADEVLYQAHIHPLCPVPALTDTNIADLHRLLREIPLKAIEVNADSSLFPDNWLFRWRWDKGKSKKDKKDSKKRKAGQDEEEAVENADGNGEEDVKPKALEYLALPDGSKATITFVTVGGRTSAVVTELQKLPTGASSGGSKAKSNSKTGAKSKDKTTKTKRAKRAKDESDDSLTELDLDSDDKPAVAKKTKDRQKKTVPVTSKQPADRVAAGAARAERAARRSNAH